MMRTTCGFIP